jgi:hypothetical protein
LAYAAVAIDGKELPMELDDILHVAKKERRVERNYTIAKTAILVRYGRGSRRTLWSIRNNPWSPIRTNRRLCAAEGSTARN